MIGAWDRFLFEPRTARVLGLYRIVFGLVVLYSFALLAQDATAFYSDEGLVSVASNDELLKLRGRTVLRWLSSPGEVKLVFAALFAAGALFTAGLYTRWSTLALFVLVVSFHERTTLVLNGSDNVLRTILFAFLFAPAGAAFSLDSLRRRLRGEGEALVAPWAQRMMQAQVTIIYLVAGGAKLIGEHYLDGTAQYYVLGRLGVHAFGVERLMDYPTLCAILTYATLSVELPLPFLLWVRATRPYATLAGILLHGWIIVFMIIPVFGIIMPVSYLPFYTESELDSAIGRLRGRLAWRRARLFVDPGRARLSRLIGLLDLLERTERVGGAPGEFRLVTAGGREYAGLAAFRWVALRCPATFWAGPLLFLPGAGSVWRRLIPGIPPAV